ncbi:hepatic lectin-like [Eleginops maclovinus]|uniref:hepatic lectin-like n=1 Tax=Eleginops maclovinus TaxID=56733 RepID=UPI0030804156
MTWTEAQSYCRTHHTDLASVRNMVDNYEVVKVLPGGAAWIGLSRDTWKWSDRSHSSFRYWEQYEPNFKDHVETCVAANFGNSGKWNDWKCWLNKYSICSQPGPVSMQVLKVRLQKPNSDVGLNDQAFLDEMLVKMKKNMRAQGLDDNI